MKQTSEASEQAGKDRPDRASVPRVAEAMTTEIMTLKPHDSFEEAVSLMANRHVRHFAVTDDSGRIAGVVSDRDIFRAMARQASWHTKTVAEIMTTDPLTVDPDTPLCDAIAKIIARRINCLPVITQDGTVCGILTTTDLLRSYQKILEAR
jgi:CBS-domain-containing membrane protein